MTHTWLNTSSYYLTIYQYFSQDVTHFHVVLSLKNKHPFLGEDAEMLKLSYKEDYAVMDQKTLCQKSMEEKEFLLKLSLWSILELLCHPQSSLAVVAASQAS